MLTDGVFWLAIGKVIWIDVLLSGDNALVIAMACRGLSPKHRLWGIILGAVAAILMRIAFTGVITTVLLLPYLKIVGGVCLFYVAVKMCVADDDDPQVKESNRLINAIIIVVSADVIMSLDNIIAVAAVAHGDILVLAIGLLLSISMIVAGATIITFILNKFPLLIWAGAALLGWISGELIASDPILVSCFVEINTVPGILGAVTVIAAAAGWKALK